MGGEVSKKSGELGEEMAKKFLTLIGWNNSISAMNIPCALQEKHRAKSHGEDRLFVYNNPFLEGVTDVVHISVKHKMDGYAKGPQGLRTDLKKHLTELNTIVACAKLSPDVISVVTSHQSKAKKNHRGLLIWLHSNKETLERDIRQDLGGIQLSEEHIVPIFLVDSGRASFIYHAIEHYKNQNFGDYNFYYPRLGNSISADHERFGKFLPLELIVSDMIPIRGQQDEKPLLYLYVREKFSIHALKKAYALSCDFADAWVDNINIGFEDYNESIHSKSKDEALLAFENKGNVSVFSYRTSLLSLLEEKS